MASKTFKNQKTTFSVTSLSNFDIIRNALSVNDAALVGISNSVMSDLTDGVYSVYAAGFCVKLSGSIVDYTLKLGLDTIAIMRMAGTEKTSFKTVNLT